MSRVFLLTVSVSQFPLGRWICFFPLVEFYALGLAVAWLSLAASVALVVAGALVVELVDVVAAVAVPVQVATVSPLRQPGLDLFPLASVLFRVSRVVFCLLRGLYHPVLGLALAQEHCLVLDLAPPFAAFGPDHPAWLPSCLSSPSWASLAWGLSWVLRSSPALPSWVSSQVAAHGSTFSPIRSWVLGVSLVMPLSLQACLDPPPAL